METVYESDFSRLPFPFLLTVNEGQSPYAYHWHDEWELVRVLEEPVRAGVGDATYDLVPGDMLLIAARIPHCFFPAGSKARRLAMKFSPSHLLPRAARERDLARVAPFSGSWPQGAAEVVRAESDHIYREFVAAEPGHELAICAHLSRILAVAVRDLPRAEAGPEVAEAGGIEAVLDYLSTHYTGDITLASCAKAVGYSAGYLSRSFHRKTGVSFHAYVTSLRLRRARWLLLNTVDPITEIAERSGFQNIKTFNRIFRSRQGLSPREYRRQGA